jgi:hypothetical protein
VDPVVVRAEAASNKQSINEIGMDDNAKGSEDMRDSAIHINSVVSVFSLMFSKIISEDLLEKNSSPPRKQQNNPLTTNPALVSLSECRSTIAGRNINAENTMRTIPST